MWVDEDQREAVPEPEQAPIEVEPPEDNAAEGDGSSVVEEEEKRGAKWERGKADGKRKDCFTFGGGSSSSSSNTGSSSSESEVEQQDRQRQMEQWNLKRPGIMEPHAEPGKRKRNT